MPPRTVRVRRSHHKFIAEKDISLSALVRNKLEEAIATEEDLPTDNQNRSGDFKRTTVNLHPRHEQYIRQRDVNFSRFVDHVIEDRIEMYRKLNEWGV